MRTGLRIVFWGTALIATLFSLGGCGGGSGDSTDQVAEGNPVHEPTPAPPIVIGHRIGPARIEPGRQSLPARPCATLGKSGTTTIDIFSDAPFCARVGPGERLLFVNDTGIEPQHADATAIGVRVGGYELRIQPQGKGLIPAPVESYLGRGSHRVRIVGAPGAGATILVVPRICAIRPPVAPGEEPCFR